MNDIKTVVIKSIFLNSTNADGKPYINKNGQPFTLANLLTEDGTRASMYCDNERDLDKLEIMSKWKPGDKQRLAFEQKGDFLNFKFPSQTQITLADHEARIKSLEELSYAEKIEPEEIDL